MSSRRSRRGLWPRLPVSVIGRPLPARFRRWSIRFVDPDWLLVELVDWLEADGPPPTSADSSASTVHERETLVLACIELRDRLPSGALQASVKQTLASVGVTEFDSDGVAFDPALHRAVGRRATDDPALHNRIAATERAGYRDRDRVLVQPEVIVYRSDASVRPE